MVVPTSVGQAELAEINRRADADMARLLEGLDAGQVRELIAALTTVERLLSSSASDTHDLQPVVRIATLADAEVISRILRRSFAEQRVYFTPEAFAASTPPAETVAERITNTPVWVAEVGRQVVGTVSAAIQASSLWIRSLAVLPEVRGAGLAIRLLAETERYAQDFDLERLELDPTPIQTAAARVYEQFGFRSGRRHQLHGTPMIRMTKPLDHGADGPQQEGTPTATAAPPGGAF